MKGKIFKESSNIYQDQAKILFDYYRQAAEQIAQEEERIESEIAKLEEERKFLEDEMSRLWKWFLTIILFFVYFIKKKGLQEQINAVDERIAEFQSLHDEIFRDYKVTKMGVLYVPIADQIKYEDKSFIVDYTGSVPESEVALRMSRRNDLLVETIGKLEAFSSEAPIVENSNDVEKIETDDYSTSIQELNQHDYLGGLERSLRTISFCMDDLECTSVSLPLVADKSEFHEFLNEYATTELPDKSVVFDVFSKDKYSQSIAKFQELNQLKDSLSTKTHQFEDVIKSLMMTMSTSVQAISALKVSSVNKIVFESNRILYNILKSPYNHYSPMLEYEEIERIRNEKFDYTEDVQSYEPFHLRQSSRVRFNPLTGMWVSEDGNTTNMPFGVHQMYEEIVAPVVQNLMNENRIERLKIYNHIKDQKISYLNKWHQDTDAFYRANRAESADIINLMQESLREYVAAYNTLISLQKTEDSMAQSNGSLDATVVDVVDNTTETLAAFELQSQEFQKTQSSFEEYMERLKDDIDQKAERFGHIEYYDAKLRDGYSNEVAVAAGEVSKLEERRKDLAEVNPLFAKTSELPPKPSVENITFEHISLNLPLMAKSALNSLNAGMGEMNVDSSLMKEESEHQPIENNEPEETTDESVSSDVEENNDTIVEDMPENNEGLDDTADENGKEDGELSVLTREDLEAMTDEELLEELNARGYEFEDGGFDREGAIEAILEDEAGNN